MGNRRALVQDMPDMLGGDEFCVLATPGQDDDEPILAGASTAVDFG